MCMAIPSRVIAVDGDTAAVEAYGQQRHVSLLLMQQAVVPGDYLLVQAGGFACEIVPAERARATLALLDEIVGRRSD